MTNLTLEQFGIIYSVVASTAAALWHVIVIVKNRDRIELRLAKVFSSRVPNNRRGPVVHEEHMTLEVWNRSRREVVAQSWSATFNKGVEHSGLPQREHLRDSDGNTISKSGLPSRLQPGERATVKLGSGAFLLENPKAIYVEDGHGKKWYAKRRVVQRAIEDARQIAAKSNQEAHGDHDSASASIH